MPENYPQPFPPPWAEAWGDDRYGLWAELLVKGVTQRLRWVAPGSFVMGSPVQEDGHQSNEGPQHTVTFTQDLWLADTACTQALWMAVVGGKNPSRFTGDAELPVEHVSWDDVEKFLTELQAPAFFPPGVEAVLPTEAEWEYTCRAGGVPGTPFSFGKNISPNQVNYDGNLPYSGAAKGEYRNKTIAVKALPANDWGLYQMHGNVWEWCSDATRTYTADAVTDPIGATGKQVENFAIRGGSWAIDAQFARSATHYSRERGRRYSFVGFRFALRSRSH